MNIVSAEINKFLRDETKDNLVVYEVELSFLNRSSLKMFSNRSKSIVLMIQMKIFVLKQKQMDNVHVDYG